MAQRGKQWEQQVKLAWKKCFPGSFIYRLADQITGNKFTSANPCDFLCFTHGTLFMIECKQHQGASIPFSAIPQYQRLLQYKDIQGVKAGVLIWFSQKDLIIWCEIDVLQQLVKDGKKSIGIKLLQDKSYNIKQVPGQKKRVFIQPDLRSLL